MQATSTNRMLHLRPSELLVDAASSSAISAIRPLGEPRRQRWRRNANSAVPQIANPNRPRSSSANSQKLSIPVSG